LYNGPISKMSEFNTFEFLINELSSSKPWYGIINTFQLFDYVANDYSVDPEHKMLFIDHENIGIIYVMTLIGYTRFCTRYYYICVEPCPIFNFIDHHTPQHITLAFNGMSYTPDNLFNLRDRLCIFRQSDTNHTSSRVHEKTIIMRNNMGKINVILVGRIANDCYEVRKFLEDLIKHLVFSKDEINDNHDIKTIHQIGGCFIDIYNEQENVQMLLIKGDSHIIEMSSDKTHILCDAYMRLRKFSMTDTKSSLILQQNSADLRSNEAILANVKHLC
jgi:hypothetical protein